MRNVSDKTCTENQILFRKVLFYVTKWEDIVQPDRPQMTQNM